MPISNGLNSITSFVRIICILPVIVSAPALAQHANPEKQAEHQAFVNLIPNSMITHTAAQSGRWSTPSTWQGGQVPGPGANVSVPSGITVEFDVFSNAAINTIRVEGTLYFAPTRDVRMTVDTIVIFPGGSFEIASEAQRLAPNRRAELLFTANGPIDRVWDPTQISRGLINHGQTRIFGAYKKAFYTLASGAPAGSTTLQLSSVPQGWRVGDTIVVTGINELNWEWDNSLRRSTYRGTEDEVRTIAALSGTTITLDQALALSHVPNKPGMPVYVANYTRNIELRTINGANVPPNERAHAMFMHNPDVVLHGASFFHIGRSDKSFFFDDFQLDSDGDRIPDGNGSWLIGPRNNIRGRYAVHFHRTGAENAWETPGICEGNAVFGSPGWGFVNHDSHVLMDNNASFDVLGAHFVTENGNELGAFSNNIAIKSKGSHNGIKTGVGNHDLGHSGFGFWFQGRNIRNENNVVSGVTSEGFAYFHRSGVISPTIVANNLLTPHIDIPKGSTGLRFHRVPIVVAKNLTVIGSDGVVTVIKAGPQQSHDIRNSFDGLYGYNVSNGIHIEYTRKYTFRNFEFYCKNGGGHTGLRLGQNNQNVSMQNGLVSGFTHAIWAASNFSGNPEDTADFVMIDVQFENFQNQLITGQYPYTPIAIDPTQQFFITASQLVPGRLQFVPDTSLSFTLPGYPHWWNDETRITGSRIDSIGSKPVTIHISNSNLRNNVLPAGHFTRTDGSKYMLIRDYVTDRLTGDALPLDVTLDIPAGHSSLSGSPNHGTPTPPTITTHPSSQIADPGQEATFSCDAGVNGYFYIRWQWQKDGVEIPGARYKEYRIDSVQGSDFGSSYRCVATSPTGHATSNAAVLTRGGPTAPAPPRNLTTN